MPTKVLVVEDNPDVMFVLLAAVDSQQCEFIGVEEGTSVLHTARTERPDLVIIDVMLPGINGIEVCRKIRKDDSLAGTKILGISGHVSARDLEPDLFDDFLEKPFDVPVLISRMAALLKWPTVRGPAASDEKVLPDQNESDPIDLTWNQPKKKGGKK